MHCIPDREYGERIRKFQANIRVAGLDAALVHGNEADFANVRYLSEYWPTFEAGGVFVPARGQPILLIGPESETYARGRSRIARIEKMVEYRESAEPQYPGIAVATFKDIARKALPGGRLRRLGLVGYSVLSLPVYASLQRDLPSVKLIKADETLMGRPGSVFGDMCRTIEKTLPESGKDREALKADFANLIAKAWYETLEGEHINVFDEPEGKIGPFTVEKVGCFPAFLVNVEHTQAFPRGDKIEPGELEEYLRLETYHDLGSLGSGLDYTYLDYVQFAKGPGFVAIKNAIEPDTNYIIAVISPSKFVGYTPPPLKAFIQGYWTGNEEAANWVLVVREDELEEVCRPI